MLPNYGSILAAEATFIPESARKEEIRDAANRRGGNRLRNGPRGAIFRPHDVPWFSPAAVLFFGLSAVGGGGGSSGYLGRCGPGH
jgi:hypothetical protein